LSRSRTRAPPKMPLTEHALERRLDRVCAVWHAVPFFLAAFAFV
jgi:hypothetical protein